jgi:acyl-CoA synthetase (AMP-forming)/AMP-acid ligase II
MTRRTDWNLADVWEAVAELLPESPALVHGDQRFTWTELDRRADGVASALLDAGLRRQDKVAHYLYNCSEYLESTFAILKAGLVPVNTNYRYRDDEIVYLWDNADACAVVFHGSFTERIERVRSRLPKVRAWLWVDDGTGARPDWALPYEEVAAEGMAGSPKRIHAPWGRSGDDLYLLYTGGTTGMPKGVMWRQDDLFCRINEANLLRVPEHGGIEGLRRTIVGPGFAVVPACPLMHGTGALSALGTLSIGGCVVTLTSQRFDPIELLDTINRENVNLVAIVGDPFARPIASAWAGNQRRWRLPTLIGIVSSGAMWSEATKQDLLRLRPTLVLLDAFSSSEAIGMGQSLSIRGSAAHTGRFVIGPRVRVLDPLTWTDVEPGSDQVGVLALGGRNPLGYYHDPEKSAATFKEVGGVRYSIPGDFAKVSAQGSIELLGRGSVVINTGGEKVYPEEVEEVIKRHPAVRDAVVVGIPDERFGQAVVSVVELVDGASVTEQEIADHVKASLAGFKAPKRTRFVHSIDRAATGKVDYPRHQAEAARWAATGS